MAALKESIAAMGRSYKIDGRSQGDSDFIPLAT